MTTSLLEQIHAAEELTPVGDIMATGSNLRLRSGDRTTFPIESMTGFIEVPTGNLRLARATAYTRQNDGMMTLRLTFQVQGEKVGVIDETDHANPKDALFPPYSSPAFASWQSWIHTVRTECLRPQNDAVVAIEKLCLDHGYVPWTLRANSRTDYERTSDPIFDLEPGVGENEQPTMNNRWKHAIQVDQATIIPDERFGVLKTQYLDGDNNPVSRAGFTGLADTLMPGFDTVIRGYAALKAAKGETPVNSAKVKELSDQHRQNMNQLSILSGFDVEGGWPLNPTVGYVTIDQTEYRIIGSGNTPTEDNAPVTVATTPDEDMGAGLTEVEDFAAG